MPNSRALFLMAAGVLVAVDARSQDDSKAQMMVVAASTLLGAEIAIGVDSEPPTACRDFLVDIRTGELTDVILEGGLVAPAAAFAWQLDAGRFTTPRLPLAGDSGPDWQRSSSGRGADRDRIGRILLGDLVGLPLRGRRDTDGDRVELGDLGGAFVDVVHHRVRFVTTSVGGVLGIGADAKVVPWSAIDIVWSDTGELIAFVRLTEERLEAAPTAENGADSVANPIYRDRVYSYFGVDRPASDRRAENAEELATIRRWIGIQVATESEGEVRVEDVLIGRERDSAVFLRLDNGLIVAADAATWTSTADGKRALRIDRGEQSARASDLFSAAALLDAEVMVDEREVGSVQNLYCHTESGEIAFVTVEIGGVLGFGGEVKALPWRLFEVATRDGDSVLRARVSAERLNEAPSVSDEPAGSIYSPGFRGRVDRFAADAGGDR